MNILLGVSGSVAARLTPKLAESLKTIGNVTVIVTDSAKHFIPEGYPYLTDKDEWESWKEEQSVLHIELRKKASALVLAPLSANTLAKMANGICDNLLTSLIRAWDYNRPVIVAPSMNTYMWENPITYNQLEKISDFTHIINPVEKTLVCGDHGIGAMANITDIVNKTKESLKWSFPIHDSSRTILDLPRENHPGAFGTVRKYDVHSGVDIYCKKDSLVYAVESGKVVGIGNFTGPEAGSPWWNNTQYILVEGASGVINYGEIEIPVGIQVGRNLNKGDYIGKVIPVLKEGKERSDIPGHSRYMLHMELYQHGVKEPIMNWPHNSGKPDILLNPTNILQDANNL